MISGISGLKSVENSQIQTSGKESLFKNHLLRRPFDGFYEEDVSYRVCDANKDTQLEDEVFKLQKNSTQRLINRFKCIEKQWL